MVLLLVAALAVPLVSSAPVLAAPSVASVTETEFDSSATNHNVAMPATVGVDDLLIVLFVNTGTSNVTTPANWNQLASNSSSDGAGGDPDVRFSVYYKKAVGNEDGTTVDFVTSASQRAAAQVYRITFYSWHGTTSPEISAAATGNSNNGPNPASLNPAGWGTEETLWIAACGFGDDDGMGAYPAGYGNGQESSASGSGDDCELNSARRVNTTASEDPGTFDISGSDTENWAAFTIAVRPAAVDCSSVKTQLAMILDGSGSIDSAEWNIMINGLAAAVTNSTCMPHDGTVELTVIQFSDDAALEVGPVVITDANAADVAAAIQGIVQMDGSTCISCGLCLAADTLAASPCFDASVRQAINLVTDGEPNECSCFASDGCNYDSSSCSGTSGQESAECAREYLLTTLQMTADQDELDAEFIGAQGPSSDWLKDEIVWPEQAGGNGYYAPPFDMGPGWVRVFATFEEFVPSLCEKFHAIIEEECTLTVTSDGCCPITVGTLGTVGAGTTGNFTVPCGTNVTLTPNKSICCAFDYWTGNVTGAPNSTSPITITMSGNKTVTGTCHWLTYNLTVGSDGCCPITVGTLGSVDPGESETFEDIPCGTNVTLTANNTTCCAFAEWDVTGSNTAGDGENIIVMTMDSNCTAVAYCDPICGDIGDTIYYDSNNNTIQDPGEGGIQDVTVQLYKDDGNGVFNIEATDELIDETTTNQDGEYEFPDLAPFCDQGYWVLVVESTLPPGVTLTTGSNPIGPICLTEEQSYEIADFGYLMSTPPVGGTAYPINKLIILLPWMALAAAIIAGIVILARRRRAQS
jgi:hypothetical protein